MSWKKVRKFRQGIHSLNQDFLAFVPIHTVQDPSLLQEQLCAPLAV